MLFNKSMKPLDLLIALVSDDEATQAGLKHLEIGFSTHCFLRLVCMLSPWRFMGMACHM